MAGYARHVGQDVGRVEVDRVQPARRGPEVARFPLKRQGGIDDLFLIGNLAAILDEKRVEVEGPGHGRDRVVAVRGPETGLRLLPAFELIHEESQADLGPRIAEDLAFDSQVEADIEDLVARPPDGVPPAGIVQPFGQLSAIEERVDKGQSPGGGASQSQKPHGRDPRVVRTRVREAVSRRTQVRLGQPRLKNIALLILAAVQIGGPCVQFPGGETAQGAEQAIKQRCIAGGHQQLGLAGQHRVSVRRALNLTDPHEAQGSCSQFRERRHRLS